MKNMIWETPYWTEGVPRHIDNYHFPLFQFLDDAARDCPDQAFTVFNGASKTFSQVRETADRIANFLATNGIQKGDKAAIFLPNLPHYPEILFGILKAGAVAVCCNPSYTTTELNYQLKDSESKIVFCMDHEEMYNNTVKAIEGTLIETVVICNIKSYLPVMTRLIGGLLGKLPKAKNHEAGHLMFDDVVASASPYPPSVSINPEEDTALMLYTGGTTGVPKGAELVHSNFTYDVLAMYESGRIVQREGHGPEKLIKGGYHTALGVIPWYHSYGMTAALLLATMSASRLVCIPDPRAGNPPFTEVLKTVQKEKPTFMPGVPTLFVAFANHPDADKYDLSSIMACFSGGAPMPSEVCRQFEDKTGAVIFEGYGLTETAPVVCSNPCSKETRRIGSIGFPLPGTSIKFLDLVDSHKEVSKGEEGEIAICGPQVMKGYWNKPDANKKVFVELDGDRYFLTGDIGRADEDGFVIITDRKKDMIIVGGFNVYPREVEDIIYTNDKVELVAVVGVPDERSGEKVKAFIQLKEGLTATEEEMKAFCKENMAGYKRPSFIEFRDEVPVSNVGKVLRRVLRDEGR